MTSLRTMIFLLSTLFLARAANAQETKAKIIDKTETSIQEVKMDEIPQKNLAVADESDAIPQKKPAAADESGAFFQKKLTASDKSDAILQKKMAAADASDAAGASLPENAPAAASSDDARTIQNQSRARDLGRSLLHGLFGGDLGAETGGAGGAASRTAAAGAGAGSAAGAPVPRGGGAGTGPKRAPAPHSLFNPVTPAELETASTSGLGQPFKQMDLRAVRDADGTSRITHFNGSPATDLELTDLRRRVADEPAVQTTRPDFFQVVPREHYDALRRDYEERPELKNTTFKDVGATVGKRDFVWAASCSAISGDCNKNAAPSSYTKGAFVTPEHVERMWADANAPTRGRGPDAAPSTSASVSTDRSRSFWDKYQKEKKIYAGQAAYASAIERAKGGISSLLSAVARAFGGGEERPAAAIVASADAAKDGQGFGAGLVMSPPSRLPSDVALLSKMPPLDLRTTSQKALVSMRALLYVGMAVLGFFLILFVRGREKSEKYTPWNFR